MGLRRRLSRLWDETTDGILSGPGIDVDSVDTESTDSNEYLFEGSEAETWKLISRQTNVSSIDVSTNLYQEIKVIVRASGNLDDVTATIDNITDQQYNQLSISDSGIAPTDGGTEWALFTVPAFGSAHGIFTISVRPTEGDRAAISGRAGTYINSDESLIRGGIDNAGASVDSIQVSMGSGSIGEIEVWGNVQ